MMMHNYLGDNLFDEDWADTPLMREYFGKGNFLYGKHAKHLLRTDVRETEDAIEADIDLPGFKKEDVSLKLDSGYLTISASKGLEKDEKEKKDGKYIRRERYEGQCSRSFYVGESVQAKDVNAKFEDGILKISVPKAAPQVETDNVIAIE